VQHVLESVFRDINADVDGGDADADGTGPVEWTVKGLKVDPATPADLEMDTGFVLEAFLPVARIGTIFRRLLSEPPVVFDQIVLLASSARTEAGQMLRKGIYTRRYPDLVSREFRVVDHTDAFARDYRLPPKPTPKPARDTDDGSGDGRDETKDEKKPSVRSPPSRPPLPPSASEIRRAEVAAETAAREAQQRRDDMAVLVARSERSSGSAGPIPPRRP
jgi:hypothetical protein